jgi:hypothetical protein
LNGGIVQEIGTMWCLETIIQINQEAARLASEGKPERDAMRNIGITMPGDLPVTEEDATMNGVTSETVSK